MQKIIKERLILDKIELSESNKAIISIIKLGESKNARIYTEQALRSLTDLVKGRRKMYLEHSDNVRDMRDWVATMHEAWYDQLEATVFGKITVHDDWLWRRICEAPQEVGISIDATGILEEENNTLYVRDIIDLNSVDFVAEAAAGGGIHTMLREAMDSVANSMGDENKIREALEHFSMVLKEDANKQTWQELDFQRLESQKSATVDKYLSEFKIKGKNEATLRSYIDSQISVLDSESIDSSIVDSTIRIAVCNLIDLAKDLNKNKKNDKSGLSTFDRAKISSLGLDPNSEAVKERYIASVLGK